MFPCQEKNDIFFPRPYGGPSASHLRPRSWMARRWDGEGTQMSRSWCLCGIGFQWFVEFVLGREKVFCSNSNLFCIFVSS